MKIQCTFCIWVKWKTAFTLINCLEEFAGKTSANYSITPLVYFGGQLFIINSKIIIFGLVQYIKYGVRCVISNLLRHGFIEMDSVAMHKLLQNLEEILRITFESKTSKITIQLDGTLFIKFTKKNQENIAYIHVISRNSRLYLEADDIKNDDAVLSNECGYGTSGKKSNQSRWSLKHVLYTTIELFKYVYV